MTQDLTAKLLAVETGVCEARSGGDAKADAALLAEDISAAGQPADGQSEAGAVEARAHRALLIQCACDERLEQRRRGGLGQDTPDLDIVVP